MVLGIHLRLYPSCRTRARQASAADQPFLTPTDAQREAIAEAARELDRLRNNWLNPPEWTREEVLEFPGSADGPWGRYVTEPDARGIGVVRYRRVVPLSDECARELKSGSAPLACRAVRLSRAPSHRAGGDAAGFVGGGR